MRMAIIKKNTSQNMLPRMWREGKPFVDAWWWCKMVQSLWKRVWRFQKTRNRIAMWFSNSTPGYMFWEKETTLNWKDACHPSVHISMICSYLEMEAASLSISTWCEIKISSVWYYLQVECKIYNELVYIFFS